MSPFSPSGSDTESDTATANHGTDEPVLDDEYIIKIGNVSGSQPFDIDRTEKIVTVDPTRGDWGDSKEELKEYWREEKGRAFTESAFGLYLSIRASKGDVNDVMDFFDPVLTSAQSSMLEEAYHLSKYFDNFNVDPNEEYERRGKLGDKYDTPAQNVPSLCSAGYFEEHGLFRDIYDQLSDSDTQDKDFQDLFNDLIRNRPFVIFVSGGADLSVGELRYLVLQKSNHLDTLPVDIEYIHVRGMGHGPEEKVSELKQVLDEGGARQMMDINRKENGPNELVLAIDSSSI
ncbi:hypothetical protein [Halovivax ruber]|uniref:hypothetical protein n=1 Tax=Halovivax ruber TaxID=387341 RepID=UPI001C0A920A|nr:hypothetical protein [Halovivax ruber]